MNSETIIYGLEKDETRRYMEDILCAPGRVLTTGEIERVCAAASKDGYHSFRVTKWDGLPPNFAATVNL